MRCAFEDAAHDAIAERAVEEVRSGLIDQRIAFEGIEGGNDFGIARVLGALFALDQRIESIALRGGVAGLSVGAMIMTDTGKLREQFA